jgi:hypothetical protein
MAGGLAAQTLSFGEITLVTPGTVGTPATYLVNVVLASSGNTVAGLQFDLNYDPNSLNVTVGLGASSTTAAGQLSYTTLQNLTNNPFCAGALATPPTACVQPQNMGPGQRAIIIGCCSTAQLNNPTNGPNPPTSNIIADGVVATLTVQATASPTDQTLHLMKNYMVGTTTGITGTGSNATNTGAQAVNLSIPTGATTDANGNLLLDLSKVYLVGSITPVTNDTSPNFGSGSLHITDSLTELFYQTGTPGYATLPAACSDYFDAMDASPVDTATTRGGDGQITISDTLAVLFYQTGTPGYTVLPVRTPRGLTCTAQTTATAKARRAPLETRATLVLGRSERIGTAQDRVPVYLQSLQDLSKVAISFSIGDEVSQLSFQAAPGLTPALAYQGTPGFVAAMFASGFDMRSGDRVLLGYVTGPAGSAANLRIFGTSAVTMNDMKEFDVQSSGGAAVRQ